MREAVNPCATALAAMLLLASASAASAPRSDVAAGRRIYSAQCAACHGAAAQGQPSWEQPGPTGDMPAPPHHRGGHTWKHSDAMLYRTVRDGWRDPYNRSDRLTMPPFGSSLTPEETRAVITYLKTWWTPEQRAFQWRESRKEPFPDASAPSAMPAAAP